MQPFELQTIVETGPIGSNVYRISQEHVAKTIPIWELYDPFHPTPFYEQNLAMLRHEHEMQQMAYELGIRVPRPEGLFMVKIHDKLRAINRFHKPASLPALVMQYIEGKTIDQLRGRDLDEARAQKQEQLELARRSGLQPKDYRFELNSIFSTEQKRLYLIDLEQWEKNNF